jgi:hypothetical protein
LEELLQGVHDIRSRELLSQIHQTYFAPLINRPPPVVFALACMLLRFLSSVFAGIGPLFARLDIDAVGPCLLLVHNEDCISDWQNHGKFVISADY